MAGERRQGVFYRLAANGLAESLILRPFYGGYNVIELDPEYRYALVCGPNRDYLWILSRTPTLEAATRDRLVQIAKRLRL
ncbi:Outer membrane lipoprotein blc precursor [Serratia fonticola]|uniref:Outer membrane lipoprotein blc n=1 Tax=Serratia fonticola TaxID=47917 RepID=A0A4U9W1C3_SERFO|nr:Outer membrane lipoprotein blc precursor [Serratia fonticola]